MPALIALFALVGMFGCNSSPKYKWVEISAYGDYGVREWDYTSEQTPEWNSQTSTLAAIRQIGRQYFILRYRSRDGKVDEFGYGYSCMDSGNYPHTNIPCVRYKTLSEAQAVAERITKEAR